MTDSDSTTEDASSIVTAEDSDNPDDDWWDCPVCGGPTAVDRDPDDGDPDRFCRECDWEFTFCWRREGDKRKYPLAEPLESQGFRAVETTLPGDWATNETLSIQITSERDVDRRRTVIARVYDAPIESLEPLQVELLAEAQSRHNVEAANLALEAAGAR